tara:strand:- start:663 stop:1430 length:768 start_codon:yes stop_codon:yes gene_type:complete
MNIDIRHNEILYSCDLSKPMDLSIPIGKVKCFYAEDVKMSPYVSGEFVGSVKVGSPVNFYNVFFNPHGNGTHTEGVGHITVDQESIMDCLTKFHFIAKVVSVELEKVASGDQIVTVKELRSKCNDNIPESLIIRTLPNSKKKQNMDYSGSNPPYLSKEAMQYIVEKGVKHLLLDLPSVDREDDGGKVENHKIFWNIKSNKADDKSRINSTITELIYVPASVKDGLYLMNLQVPSIILDAAPSKPVLYYLEKKKNS